MSYKNERAYKNKQAYKKKQIEMVFDQLPLAYTADFATGFTLVALLLYMGSGLEVYIWYGLLCSLTLARLLLARKVRRSDYSVRRKTKFLFVATLIGGTLWGLSWLMVVHEHTFLHVCIVGLWIAGMIAGAAASLSVLRPLFFAFAVPASALYVFYLLVFVAENTFLYLGAYTMYLCFMVPLALRISSDLNRSIRMQIANSRLRAQLMEDALRLKEREDELLVREQFDQQRGTGGRSMETVDGDISILDSVSEGIYGINYSGRISFINSSALELLGYKESDVIGRYSHEVINRYHNSLEEEGTANLAIIGAYRDGDSLQNIDSTFYRKNRTGVPVRFSCKPVKKGLEVIGTVVSFSDLTKQREMESMLIQAQKMEAIGRLTGGIAHDFNNLLTVILGNLHFLQKRLVEDDGATALLNKIMNAAKSGAQLSNRLLSFSREQALVREPVDVVEMVSEMREFIDRVLGEDVELALTHQGERCIAMTDRNRLESAIFNLCINARDAMPRGGRLTIAIRPSCATDRVGMPVKVLGNPGHVVLSIADTGTGISKDVQKNIFDPFFTTKEIHRGTGLGLSSVYGFVKQSGGNIFVESEIGVGSTFTLFIPAAEKGVLPRKVERPRYKQAQKHEGTILVVEDDDSVREVADQMLTEAGFEVLSARDGPTGLNKFDKHADEVDLLFSDMVMPGGMNGVELAQRVLARNPSLPVILVTGHTENNLKDCMKDFKNVLIIQKPYDTNDLPDIIHSMINQASTSEEPVLNS